MSKTISYDFGHMEGGQDGSANGYVYEYKVVRDYGKVCVDKLRNAGYNMVNCTPPNGSMTVGQSLSYRVNHSDSSGSVIHLCFHANAFKNTDSAMGSEMEVASNMGAKYGQSILTEICKLGFKSRGVKTPSLYVTGHTRAVAILCEPFFIDSRADVALYNANTLGTAIANGVIKVLGGTIQTTSPSSNIPAASKPSTYTPVKNGIVTASTLNIRSGASTSSSIVGTLKNGDKVRVAGKIGNFYSIFFGEHGAWVSCDYIKDTTRVSTPSTPKPSIPTSGTVTASVLNVRSGAGVNYNVIGSYNKGDKVKIARKIGNFYETYFGDHGGWVSCDYVK